MCRFSFDTPSVKVTPNMSLKKLSTLLSVLHRHRILTLLVCVWGILVSLQPNVLDLVGDFGGFLFLGVIGAVFANATGAGGGVVFVPFFNQLGFESSHIVATSFAIQCCGMTAGALAWWRFYRTLPKETLDWQPLVSVLTKSVPSSLCGVWLAQLLGVYIPTIDAFFTQSDILHTLFGGFSIALSAAIFATIPLLKRARFRSVIESQDKRALIAIGLLGGFVTAWLSVGVGELVAVYLIIRGFNVTMAIASAVILTAVTVWGAVGFHVIEQHVIWQVVVFAGAGAVIGGRLAKYVVLAYSAVRLKIFFAFWVLIMGLSGLPVWA